MSQKRTADILSPAHPPSTNSEEEREAIAFVQESFGAGGGTGSLADFALEFVCRDAQDALAGKRPQEALAFLAQHDPSLAEQIDLILNTSADGPQKAIEALEMILMAQSLTNLLTSQEEEQEAGDGS